MRFCRAFVLAVAPIAIACSPMRSVSAASRIPSHIPLACKLGSMAVQQVLGVSGHEHYAGPEVMSGGTCTWRTTDPSCFLRVLSVRRHSSSPDLAAVMRLLAEVKPFDRAPDVLGTDAFYAHTDLGAGAAIAIERIYVPRSDRSWVEVSLSGRLGPDGSRALLLAAAKAVPRLVG